MTKVKLSFMHLLVVFMVANICNASRSRVTSSIKVHKQLNLLNKAPVKSIKSPDGDTIDCVHISHQPAFDHPILKNHTIIKTRPSYHPDWIKDVNNKMNGSKVGSLTSPPRKHESITQLWHSNGKCPKGTIPIRRTNKDDVKKKHSLLVAQPSFTDVRKGHEYAIVNTNGVFYGAKATLNLWNPMIQEQKEFSLGQLWITGGSIYDLNTIEAGWQVAPPVFGDTNTRLFIYWTSDGYQHTGCYNHQCSGFIQTNNEIALGGSISPTSQVINIASGGQHTTTQMGSGHFPQEGAGKASYIKDIQIVDESNNFRTPQGLSTYTPEKSCYDILMDMNDNSGSQIFYGGPGRNENCP
ncbi:hypothetical protein E3N88_14072 [Mikania micrantha]|uniref:Neprosin PEP catalytic domain-containing protein n=1 Tax=Mikania micrantha TaxID=192012 RepID=A0A5N6P0S2_9ASTR|nr:hypothetical protein E3N88_14072 [Mikania micrantha]